MVQKLLIGLVLIVVALFVYVMIKESRSDKMLSLDPALWSKFKDSFIQEGRVVDRENRNISHTEGQGYGMLLAEAAKDKKSFDALWSWTKRVLEREDGLYSWKYEPCPSKDARCITDKNNATDGEILISWALLRAYKRWGEESYFEESKAIAGAVIEKCLVRKNGLTFLLPGLYGFHEKDLLTLNPSYYIFPAFEAFAKNFGHNQWQELIKSGEWIMKNGLFGKYNLPPDWIELEDGTVKISRKFDPLYGYNAVRVPLYASWAREGNYGLKLSSYAAFWSSYKEVPAWINLETGETASYKWSTGMKAVAKTAQKIVNGTEKDREEPLHFNKKEGYYSMVLYLLSNVAAKESQK